MGPGCPTCRPFSHPRIVHFAAEYRTSIAAFRSGRAFPRTNVIGTPPSSTSREVRRLQGPRWCRPIEGLRLSRRYRAVPRSPPSPDPAPLREQGLRRPTGSRRSLHVWPGRRRHPVLQQLRPLPIPQKLIPLMIIRALEEGSPFQLRRRNVCYCIHVHDDCEGILPGTRERATGPRLQSGGEAERENIAVRASYFRPPPAPSVVDPVRHRPTL